MQDADEQPADPDAASFVPGQQPAVHALRIAPGAIGVHPLNRSAAPQSFMAQEAEDFVESQ